MIKYIVFSISAGLIELGLFTLFNEVFLWQFWLAYTVALTCSVTYNFTINRKFTFKSVRNYPRGLCWALGFYLLFAPYSIWLGHVLEQSMNEYLVLLICMVQNLILEFIWWKFFIFKSVTKP